MGFKFSKIQKIKIPANIAIDPATCGEVCIS
jgi:hypothetical protein